jgi:hypothetical protein
MTTAHHGRKEIPMLAKTSFPRDYLESTRAAIDARVAAFRKLGDVGDFETVYFNDLVLVLELAFVHRLRNAEGKDGNALNEVRLLAVSLLTNGGRLVADKQVKLRPETSVLGYAAGDEIAVREDGFLRLADAFFAEIAARYPA